MNKDWRKTSENEDTESIVDYYIEKNILKNPKDYKIGSSLNTIWFDSLTDKEKKVYSDKVSDEWGERFLPQNYTTDKWVWETDSNGNYIKVNEFSRDTDNKYIKVGEFVTDKDGVRVTEITEMNQSEFMDRVDKKLDDREVTNYVEDLETQPTELPINIPSTPFLVGDGSDGIESDELSTKQNQMMMDYLKRKGWSFGDWWKYEGEERIKEHITDIRKDGDIDYKDEIGWWDDYFNENIDVLGDRLIEEECSLYRRIYLPMKVRKGGFKDLEKWEQEYFLDGITKGYWDKGGNHIGDNSNPYIKKKKRITES